MDHICQNEFCDNPLNALAIKRGGKYCCYDCAKQQDKINAHRTRHTNAGKAARYDAIVEAYRLGGSPEELMESIKRFACQPINIPPIKEKRV